MRMSKELTPTAASRGSLSEGATDSGATLVQSDKLLSAGLMRRRVDLDCLHIIICFTVIVAHCLLIFSPQPFYHLKNATLSVAFGMVDEFIRTCTLPLFFLLSGWSSLVSLRSRGISHFLAERWRRLLVPLVVGIILFCPPIKYIELLQGRDLRPSGLQLVAPTELSFFEFVPRFFTRVNHSTWSHLWFLAYLMLFSLIFLPLLARLARVGSTSRSDPSSAVFAYLPVLPLALLLVGFHGWWPFYPNLYKDWVNFSYFGLYFLLGAVMAAYPPFEDCVRREWLRLGLVGLIAFVGVLFSIDTGLGRLLIALTAWASSSAALGLAARFRPVEGRVLKYLREATLPLYILHHVLVVVLGWYVIQLPLGIAAKFCLLIPLILLATIAVYHFLIRRLPVFRFLFGMRPMVSGTTSETMLRGMEFETSEVQATRLDETIKS